MNGIKRDFPIENILTKCSFDRLKRK